MLFKLALRNVRRQIGNYLIYFMTVAFMVAMLFSVSNIIFSENLQQLTAVRDEIYHALTGVVIVISAIVAFVLSYATSFMLKLRKREFGTYLTLGMTRRNILSIFLSETVIIGGLALGAGLIMGLFIYQGLTALMMNLLEMQFTLSAYSCTGLLMTIALVAGIFLVASMTSAVYLKRVSIYDLLHGNKKKREIKHPTVWFLITLLSLTLIIGSIFFIRWEVGKGFATGDDVFSQIVNAVMLFSAALILFHMGLARSLIHLFIRKKRFCSSGSNMFVLRSLSDTLGSNSVMLGFLAFLLTFAVIGTNAALIQKTTQEESLSRNYPYDVIYAANGQVGDGIPIDEAEVIIEKYVGIKSRFSYCDYTSGRNDFYGRTEWSESGLTDNFVCLSDFNALIEPLGYKAVTLSDECMVVASEPKVETFDWNGFSFEQNGKLYKLKGVYSDYPIFFSYAYFCVVVPDEAAEGMKVQTQYVVYDTEDGPYDAAALKEELTYESSFGDREWCDYNLREYGRQEENSINAFLVIAALFMAVVFLFMGLAILALKTLSGLADDRGRYGILYHLGLGEKEQKRTLFHQTFSFFMLPFALPLLMNIPTALICRQILQSAGMGALMPQIGIITCTTAAVMTALYLLYYAAAYQIAKSAVVSRSF